MRGIKTGGYNHKFTLTPKYGNWSSPDYVRSTVLFTQDNPVGTIKQKKTIGGRLVTRKKSNKSFNKMQTTKRPSNYKNRAMTNRNKLYNVVFNKK